MAATIPIPPVQIAGIDNTALSTVPLPIIASIPAGTLVTVVAGSYHAGGFETADKFSCADSQSNSYSKIGGFQSSGSLDIFYSYITTTLAPPNDSITITINTSNGQKNCMLVAHQWPGMPGAFDNSGFSTNATPSFSGTSSDIAIGVNMGVTSFAGTYTTPWKPLFTGQEVAQPAEFNIGWQYFSAAQTITSPFAGSTSFPARNVGLVAFTAPALLAPQDPALVTGIFLKRSG